MIMTMGVAMDSNNVNVSFFIYSTDFVSVDSGIRFVDNLVL